MRQELFSMLLVVLDHPSSFDLGQWVVTPWTAQPDLAGVTRQESGEAEAKILMLPCSVLGGRDLAGCAVDELLVVRFVDMFGISTKVVSCWRCG